MVERLADGTVIFKGEKETRDFQYITLRHALKLELAGLRHSSGRSVSTTIKNLLNSKTQNKLKLLSEYEDWMEEQGFKFKRYTETVKLTQG